LKWAHRLLWKVLWTWKHWKIICRWFVENQMIKKHVRWIILWISQMDPFDAMTTKLSLNHLVTHLVVNRKITAWLERFLIWLIIGVSFSQIAPNLVKITGQLFQTDCQKHSKIRNWRFQKALVALIGIALVMLKTLYTVVVR